MQELALITCLTPLSQRLAVIQAGKVVYQGIDTSAVEINLDPYLPLFKDKIVINMLGHFRRTIWELQSMESYTMSADVVCTENEDYIVSNYVKEELDDYDFILKDYQIKIGAQINEEPVLEIQLKARPKFESVLTAAESGSLLWICSQLKIVPYSHHANLAEIGNHLFALNYKNIKNGVDDANFGRVPLHVYTGLRYQLELIIKKIDQGIEAVEGISGKKVE